MTAHYRQIPLFGIVPRHFRANFVRAGIDYLSNYCVARPKRFRPGQIDRVATSVALFLSAILRRAGPKTSGSQGRPEAGEANT